MPTGGARPGAGRKTNAERAARALREQLREHKLFEISAAEEKEFWATVKQQAMGGKRDAQKLLAEYLYGRPSQKQHEHQDPTINLFCSFRGQPYVCLKCGELDEKAIAGSRGQAAPDESEGSEGETGGASAPGLVHAGGEAGPERALQ